jgi:hypothetical protein
MKKLLFSAVLMMLAFLPVVAQDAGQSEEVPVDYLTLKKGNIPPAVLKAAEDIFKEHTQTQWGVFPYQMKDYGWVADKEYNEPIDHYEIHMKTKEGVDVFAVFEATGELISYRTVNKNATVPMAITKVISAGPYKDWTVMKGTEVITNKQRNVVEHYAVKLEKGNQKKTLYYTIKGDQLTNKK